LVSAEDPDWQLRILDVHTQFSAPSLGMVSNVAVVMGSVSLGTFLGAVLSGNTNGPLLAMLFLVTVGILSVMALYTVSLIGRRKKFLRGLQRLASGHSIPNFAEFLKEIEV